MHRPSQLAALDLSDERIPSNGFLEAKLAEARRELIGAYERNDQFENAVRGLLGMLRQIGSRPDVSAQLRTVLLTHPHVLDAQEILL